MSSSDGPRFACPTCGKSYRWKPEFAGRGAKCACGSKLVVPSEAPATSSAVDVRLATDARPAATTTTTPQRVKPLSQTAGDSKCPSCSAPLASGAILCVNCGYNLETGQTLAAAVVETDAEEESEDDAADAEERA